MAETISEEQASVSRRSALKLVGGAAVLAAGAAVLAACGSGGAGNTGGSGSTSASSTAAGGTTSSSAAGGTGGSTGSSSGAIKVTGGTGKQFVSTKGSTVTLVSRGADCWGSNDTCTFLNTKATGDATWVVKVDSLDATDNWAKAGIMLRNTLDDTSADVFLAVTVQNGVDLQYREADGDNEGSTNGDNDQLDKTQAAPVWLKLQKKGGNYTGWFSTDGKSWQGQMDASQNGNIKINANYLVGIAATSHNAGQHGNAVFEGWQGPALGSADAVGTNDSAQ